MPQYLYELCPRCRGIDPTEGEPVCHRCGGSKWALAGKILSKDEHILEGLSKTKSEDKEEEDNGEQ